LIRDQRRSQLGTTHANIDVAAARDFKFLKAGDGTDAGDDLFGNFARSLAKFLGQFESEGQRILAEFDFRRLFHDDVRGVNVVGATQKLAQMFDQSAFQISIQGCPLSYC
jgi:hypothetical protein